MLQVVPIAAQLVTERESVASLADEYRVGDRRVCLTLAVVTQYTKVHFKLFHSCLRCSV